MTFDETCEVINHIQLLADQLADHQMTDEVLTPAERIDLYARCDLAVLTLGVAVRDLRTDATLALADLEVPKDGTFDTGYAVVKRSKAVQPGTSHKWRGHALCDALASDYVNPTTGEIERAVPVWVMRDTVAGCASPEHTSSGWRSTGLRGRVDEDRYHVDRPTYVDAISIVKTRNPDEDDMTVTVMVHE